MLTDSDIEKLCYGRIVLVSGVLDSLGKSPVGPHWAVILDDEDTIAENGNAMVAMISTKEYDEGFLFPVPDRTGLIGNVVCSWQPPQPVELAAMIEVHPAILTTDEMLAIDRLIRKFFASRT